MRLLRSRTFPLSPTRLQGRIQNLRFQREASSNADGGGSVSSVQREGGGRFCLGSRGPSGTGLLLPRPGRGWTGFGLSRSPDPKAAFPLLRPRHQLAVFTGLGGFPPGSSSLLTLRFLWRTRFRSWLSPGCYRIP